jgi:hypothetical protein
MSSDFELEDLSNKGQAAPTPPDASLDRSLHPPTYLEEPKESTTTSWVWASSIMFVEQSIFKERSDRPGPACRHGRVPSFFPLEPCFLPLGNLDT